MQIAKTNGFDVKNNTFGDDCTTSKEHFWALCRVGGFEHVPAIFNKLRRSDDVELWKLITTELFYSGRCVDNLKSNSLLHLIVRDTVLAPPDQLLVFQHITQFNLNPFVPNAAGETAAVLAQSSPISLAMQRYARWRPQKEVMSWYGPFCRSRMRAFLLVEKRLQLGLNRDVKMLILAYIAETESLWVFEKVWDAPERELDWALPALADPDAIVWK
jgi:hypothetical protein